MYRADLKQANKNEFREAYRHVPDTHHMAHELRYQHHSCVCVLLPHMIRRRDGPETFVISDNV